MHLNTRGQRSSFPMCFLLMTLVAGCAVTPTPLAQFPDFPKMRPALGTLVVLADITSLHYMSGDIQKLDLAESEQLGIILLDEVANGLRQKGYVVGNTIHATTGWTLRPGTSVYLIRTPEDRNRDPLPLTELPIYVNREFVGDPALQQAWVALRASSVSEADARAALSRLGQAFGADTLVIVVAAGRHVPLGTQTGRAMLSALTFGATSAPATTAAKMILFADPRSGRVLWQDAAPPGHSLSEQGVRALAADIVRALP